MFGTTKTYRNGAQKLRSFPAIRTCQAKLIRLRSLSRSYTRDEDGSLIIFGIFTFIIVLVLAGIGVDMIRHETLRTELQNTLDRAVLAAANRQTSAEARDVVEDYFAKAGLTEYLESVKVEGAGYGRRVTATVTADIPTFFLRISGIDNLELIGSGAAEQGMAELEVALVLDVSGSMNNDSRLDNLEIAGREFASTVFNNSAEGHVAVSVVPYATQVNIGPVMASHLARDDAHELSHCVNFQGNDFYTTEIDQKTVLDGQYYEQTMHFDPFNYLPPNSGTSLEVCNPDEGNRVLPFATTLTEVTDKIEGLVADGNTSIDVGVKWGAALLDPSTQGIDNAIALDIDGNVIEDEVLGSVLGGIVDDTLDGVTEVVDTVTETVIAQRPHEFSSATLKVMVVMTDGVNTAQYYMPENYRRGESDIYVHPTNDRVSFKTTQNSCSWWYGCTTQTRYYAPHNDSYYTSPYGGDAARKLEWPEVWQRFTVESHAYTRYEASGNSNDYYNWLAWTRHSVGSSTKDERLLTTCQAAKDKGIIVFTIGFEAPSDAASILKTCASSPSHYFDADGLQIAEAFGAVATKITELRLVE
ncbi:Flp pilus assembly protein TadG [Pacificibacter maritimus]|uniref:Flp pilus assembly protein TadG n=1 Tax=Pacificibacter maritimus TaxID=762213 RepID=A0A3N4VDS7_9RHOB|nr:pilus assembly protein TadG-related protein [Pacificibacter maritimus]RPE72010.1 Flp pilus assembly protein TadG [Pacificibacter maritimus]